MVIVYWDQYLSPLTALCNGYSVFALSAVDRWFNPQMGQTNDYKIDFYWFSAKCAALRRKCKDWLARNRDNVAESSDMSTCELLFFSELAL